MSEIKQQNTDSITWWGIGLSILAANVAYDYLHVGASMGFTKGLALGSYEWTGCLLMIFVLLFIFPVMMSSGVKTTPEYLGLRFNQFTRSSVATIMVLGHVLVVMVPVLYSASLALTKWYGLSYNIWLSISVLIITLILIFQNIVMLMRINIILNVLMIAVGIGVMIYCFYLVGGLNKFAELGAARINSFLDSQDKSLPWHVVIFGGLWVAHAYYWSYNQFIQQFVLQSNTLSKAQFGFLLIATIKLIIPFIILIPGVTLFILNDKLQIANAESAFSVFVSSVLPSSISGIVLLIYLLTLICKFSTVGFSGVNIVMNDMLPQSIVNRYKEGSVYRLIIIIFMSISLAGAMIMNSNGEGIGVGLMKYTQEITSSIEPTIVAIFTLGIFCKFITTRSANIAILSSIPLFLLFRWIIFPGVHPLNTGGIIFLFQCAFMIALSYFLPEKPKEVPFVREIRFERNLLVVIWSIMIITFVFSIYWILL